MSSDLVSLSPSTRRVPVANGLHLHVAEAGQGTPLLLLHGFPDNGDLWQPLLPTLAAEHRLWMPDLRGYRHSDKPTAVADYAIAALVADVKALADAMGGAIPGRVAVAGHDWGGMLAWAFAALHPECVERLVIFNAPHPCRFAELLRDDSKQREASSYVMRLSLSGAETVLAADHHARLRALMLHSLPRMPSGELDGLAAGWAVPGALTAMLNWYRALESRPAARAVPSLGHASGRIEAPTLILWGEHDGSFVPANLEGLERWVPRLQVRRFPDAGHWLPREQPAAVAAAMLEFLGDMA
jgi:epoxide hydrolase 4